MDKSQTVKISPKIDKKTLVSFKIIHEKEATPEAAPEKEMVTKPRGLINYGNTCFFNTALQLLASSNRFTTFIHKKTQEKTGDSNNDKHDESMALLKYVCELLDKNTDQKQAQEIQGEIWKIITKHKSEYKNGQQQDCHECVIFIIDFLNSALLKQEKNDNIKRKISLGKDHSEIMKSFGNFYWEEHTYRMEHSIKSFHGLYHSSTTCTVCKTENNKWDIFNNVSLMINHKNFKEWLVDFCKQETLEGYECEKCKKHQTAIRQMEVWRYPKTLILHSISKTFKNINTELVVNEPVHGKCKFILKSVGFHSGNTLDSGHYYCCVNRDSKWWFISDEAVSEPIDPFKELPNHINNSYLLLYERIEKNMN